MLLGIDIGGTKCAVILGERKDDAHLAMLEKEVIPTDRPVYAMIEALFVLAETMLQTNAVDKQALEVIGISCGGPLSSKR